MVKGPEVSVIVSAHNEEVHVGRAIRSLMNQDMASDSFEIIVVNDGSSDNTAYALELFKEEIRVLQNGECRGLAYSLNKGIKAARGKYVVRVDADDYVHSSYLSTLRSFLEQNRHMDAVACDYFLVDSDETFLERKNCLEDPIGCGIMFRIEHLIEIGLYDEEFWAHEDADLRIRFLKKFNISRIELPLYRYRQHEKNMTKDLKRMKSYEEKLKGKHSQSVTALNWSGRGHAYTKDEINAVVHAMETADPLTQGKYQAKFEADFSEYIGCKSSFAVSSCTGALELSAVLCQFEEGDEVIIPAHTFAATAIPFARTKAKIVWADINPETLVVDEQTLRACINERTKAIVIVHLYGQCCEMDPILELVNENNLILIEDVAQAIGVTYKGRKAGTFGDLACFSYHGAKNMSTLGEGGMLAVNNEKMIPLVPGLRHNGMCAYEGEREYYWKPAMGNVESDIPGVWPYNFCLGEIQCAVGSELLKRLPATNKRRCDRASKVRGALADFRELVFQRSPVNCGHVHHLLPLKYESQHGKNRDDLISLLFNKYKIKAVVQYYPLYRYPLFVKEGLGEANCPNTDEFFDNMCSLPFHDWMKEEELDYLIDSLRKACLELRGELSE